MNDLDRDIFNLTDEQPQPVPGSLLVAKPTVGDDVFARSVVLLIHHDEEGDEGSMGLIVNRPTNYTLAHVLPDMPHAAEIPLYLGGPVELEVMFFLHTLGNDVIPKSLEVASGLYLGGDFESVKRYLGSGEPIEGCIKFIVGYSGWGKNQLDHEIGRHDWAVLNDWSHLVVMGDDWDQMWRTMVSRFGERYRLWLNLPDDPQFN
ncbi:MAG: YqgE/AlgH family protein [Muribaculaceae bacterium]|nr:YqgE/AlgH family protein [Muribaculaceae bacterium]